MVATLKTMIPAPVNLTFAEAVSPRRRSNVRRAVHAVADELIGTDDLHLRSLIEKAEDEALLAELRIVELENKLIRLQRQGGRS